VEAAAVFSAELCGSSIITRCRRQAFFPSDARSGSEFLHRTMTKTDEKAERNEIDKEQ
jgi:hypothetical protein